MDTWRRSRTIGLRRAAALAVVCGSAVMALADGSLTPVAVRTGAGIEPLVIASPEAPVSAARRVHTDIRPKAGGVREPSPGYTLLNRVIARESAALTDWLVAKRDVVGHPLPGAQGFLWIETASVGEAVELAHVLSMRPGIEAYVDTSFPTTTRSVPTDPSFPLQWHLQNAQDPGRDANVVPAWGLGYTGEGVVIGVIDIGNVQNVHGDLSGRYLPQASITAAFIGAHATAVAGVAVATADNGYGGAGVAYRARYGTMPQGSTSQIVAAFGHRNDLIHIKNNSWGPIDNGTATQMPSAVATALETAVLNGRDGKGVSFVWAGGNGGAIDRVDYDPYASSRYVIAVGAIDDDDDVAGYSEFGSSLMLVAPSDGGPANRGIFTTDLLGASGYAPGDFTSSFGGTSAAAPIVSGVVALMLEANPDLTWRDIQHVLIHSTRICDPSHPTWTVNSAGYPVSYAYGFGAVDAGAAVVTALEWPVLPAQIEYDSGVVAVGAMIADNDPVGVTRSVTIPGGIRIETVELVMNATSTFIGDLHIDVRGPRGTSSLVATARPDPGQGYTNQVFTSRRHFGEDSGGVWSVHVSDRAPQDVSTWTNFRLVIRGTPGPCAADMTGSTDPTAPSYGVPDGVLDGSDFFYFLDRFVAGDLAGADLTGSAEPTDPAYGVPDGMIDAADFFYYLDLFTAGCV